MPRKVKKTGNKEQNEKRITIAGWLVMLLGVMLFLRNVGLIPYVSLFGTFALMLVGVILIARHRIWPR